MARSLPWLNAISIRSSFDMDRGLDGRKSSDDKQRGPAWPGLAYLMQRRVT
jgi:hypothetical protein